jgi:hypothetical protein
MSKLPRNVTQKEDSVLRAAAVRGGKIVSTGRLLPPDVPATSFGDMPPLPEPEFTSYVTDSVMRSLECTSYTADQMQAYAAAAVKQDRADALRYRWAIAEVDNADALLFAVVNNGGDAFAISDEIDDAIRRGE